MKSYIMTASYFVLFLSGIQMLVIYFRRLKSIDSAELMLTRSLFVQVSLNISI